MKTFSFNDLYGEVSGSSPQYDTLEECKEAIRKYVADGENEEWKTHYETFAIREKGEYVESMTVPNHPPEPGCDEAKEHDWKAPVEIVGGIEENPGCWGKGGGVEWVMVCMHCAMGKHYTNWATNPENGTEGHEAYWYVWYEFEDKLRKYKEEEPA